MNTDQLIAKRAACGCCHGRAGVIIDGKEWKLVPVEATQAMLDAAEKIDWSGEDVLGNCCNQWYAMLAAAPPAPVVEVTKATCAKVARANVDARLATAPDEILESATAIEALAWLFKWQQVLVPTIGMVTREELARAVEAAYMEARLDADDGESGWKEIARRDWLKSRARKALGGGE